MNDERLKRINNLQREIREIERKLEGIKRCYPGNNQAPGKLSGLQFYTPDGRAVGISIDKEEVKFSNTIGDLVESYYQKRLAILQKRFEVL